MGTIGDRLKLFRESKSMRQEDLANAMGVKKQFISNVETGVRGLSIESLTTIGALGADLTWLMTGKGFMTPSGKEIVPDDFRLVTLIPQKVAAGLGQEMVSEPDPSYITEKVPAPRSMFHNGEAILAVRVKGDSMTGISLFGGDIAYYSPGTVDGDGIYVLQVHGDVIIKRVAFDAFEKKLVISSENQKYPDRVEPQDSQAVMILGKVRGWYHIHPY